MTRFDRDTGVRPLGEGVYEGPVDRAWFIAQGPNGGTLAATILRALTTTVDDPGRPPRSFVVHYTRPPAEGPITIRTTVERSGRSLATLSARVEQGDKLMALALAAFSRPWEAPEFSEIQMPDAPAPEELETRPDRAEMPFTQHFDFRWALGIQQMGGGGKAETGAWMRLREPRTLDPILATQLADAWAPAIFTKVVPPGGAVPTIDLTVHFREPLPLEGAEPEDWIFGVFATRKSRDGFIEEDGELWSRDGRLLVQSRQLAILPG